MLPFFPKLDVAAFSRIFSKTTNSYKFLFFISVLDILKRNNFDHTIKISFDDIVVQMLVNAWYPYRYFKLSFGAQDKIASKLDSLKINVSEPIIKFTGRDLSTLRKEIYDQNISDIVSYLSRYVPYRLLAPFFKNEIIANNIKQGYGSELDDAMPRIVLDNFEKIKPLYKFNSDQKKDCNCIELHSDWAEYIKIHYNIVRSWIAWGWLNYMQRRNPNTPGLANKLFMPCKRDSLNKQTEYWNAILSITTKISCIYSGKDVSRSCFSLDHYLPWSFVAHDQLWNLIPTTKSVNSSKSNSLPSQRMYFDKFVKTQHLGLTIAYDTFPEKKWNKATESFVNDLKISPKDLLNYDCLYQKFDSTIQPLLSLATNQGFFPNWEYSN